MLIEFQQVPLPMDESDTEPGKSFKVYFTMWLKRLFYTELTANNQYGLITRTSTCVWSNQLIRNLYDEWGISVLGSRDAWNSVKTSMKQWYWVLPHGILNQIIHGTQSRPSLQVDLFDDLFNYPNHPHKVEEKINSIYTTYLKIPKETLPLSDKILVGAGVLQIYMDPTFRGEVMPSIGDWPSAAPEPTCAIIDDIRRKKEYLIKTCKLQISSLQLMEIHESGTNTPTDDGVLPHHHSQIFAIE